MKKIREFAKEAGHEIIGKLTSRPDLKIVSTDRNYTDEAGNEYIITKDNVVVICTADGRVF